MSRSTWKDAGTSPKKSRGAEMSRPSAPSMPTENQIKEAHKIVSALSPGARIARVGPEGVVFEYPDAARPENQYQGKPFAPVRG